MPKKGIHNPRRTARSIRIHHSPEAGGGRVAVRYARTDKTGLTAFFLETLKDQGYLKPKIVGNVLQVEDDQGDVHSFVCYPEVQA